MQFLRIPTSVVMDNVSIISFFSLFVLFLCVFIFEDLGLCTISGADLAFVIRGGPNSERFLSNLRKLLKRGKFFLTTHSVIVQRN